MTTSHDPDHDPSGGSPPDHGHGGDHGAENGHGHSHDHVSVALSAGARYRNHLAAAFVVLAVFLVVEAVVGFITGSLALLSDAAHMFTDVLGIGLALAAIHVSSRVARSRHDHRTFGLYRLEILAALANAVLLVGVAVWVLVEAGRRVGDPVEVTTTPMLVAALLGLAANLVAFWLLRDGAKESLNIEGAYLEVVADTVGSVGVIFAAVVIGATGWWWVDTVVAVAIGLFILPRTWRLASQALRILLQAAPPGTDLGAVTSGLESIPGVVDVHDLHVWTLTSDMDVATAHIRIQSGTDHHGVLDQARDLLAESHGIQHATIQVEPTDHEGCDSLGW